MKGSKKNWPPAEHEQADNKEADSGGGQDRGEALII